MKINVKISIMPKLALILATLIWGSSFVIMKTTVDIVPVYALLAIRFTGAFVFLFIISVKKLKIFTKDYLICGLLMGIFIFSGYCFQTFGLTSTTPGKNAFLTSVYCVIVPFMFWITDKNKPATDNIFAAFLCIVGIGFVSLTEAFTIGIGDILTLVGGFMFAAHIVVIAKKGKDLDPVLLTAIQFGCCSIIAWSASFLFEGIPDLYEIFTSNGVFLSLLYLSLVCTGICLLLQTIGQKYTHPSAASIILALEGVFGVAFSIILYKEQMTAKLILGFSLIFISVLTSEIKPLNRIRCKR